MKAVILAGGFGTRLAEETGSRPKPMVEIGEQPIIWHIMKLYAAHGISDFVICLGYKGYIIKEYFCNYHRHVNDIRVNTETGETNILNHLGEDWNVWLVETGLETMTGGRLKRVARYLDGQDFFLTYGDGVADIDLTAELAFHRKSGRLATVAAVRPPGRFGALALAGDTVTHFIEKPSGDGGYINGGFFVLSPKVIDYIDGDQTVWEREPMERLATERQLSAYRHDGFWQPMDTLRDKRQLDELWRSGRAPWRVWARD